MIAYPSTPPVTIYLSLFELKFMHYIPGFFVECKVIEFLTPKLDKSFNISQNKYNLLINIFYIIQTKLYFYKFLL